MADVTAQGNQELGDTGGSSRRGRPFLKLLGLVALVVAGFLLARATPVGEYLTRDGVARVVETVRGNPAAPVLFVVAYAVATALALPGSVLTLAGGALFGFGWGVVFNTVGANLGANAAFGVARSLGREGVERLAGDRLEKFDRATRNHGFRGLLTLRLIPLVPFNALNFGSGLTSISWGTYAVATGLGIFPGTVVYTLFADALLQGSQEASREAFLRLVVAGALLVFLSFLPTIVKKLGLRIGGGTAVLVLAAGMLLPRSTPASAAGISGPGPVLDREATLPVADAGSGAASLSVPADLPGHEAFTALLSRHVRGGRVDYAALEADRAELDAYLSRLASTDPADLDGASLEDRLAFWINAYNACMLKLVVDHYPLDRSGESRLSLLQRIRNFFADRPENSVWQIPDVFTRPHCTVAGADRSQDQIEHEVIRPMGEPRIHFAVNCAAVSCPVLASEAYVGERLDEQLDRQVRRFVDEERHFRLDSNPPVLHLNRVLEWYGEDFGGTEGVREFFVEYTTGDRRALLEDPRTRVVFVEYDWTLNDVQR